CASSKGGPLWLAITPEIMTTPSLSRSRSASVDRMTRRRRTPRSSSRRMSKAARSATLCRFRPIVPTGSSCTVSLRDRRTGLTSILPTGSLSRCSLSRTRSRTRSPIPSPTRVKGRPDLGGDPTSRLGPQRFRWGLCRAGCRMQLLDVDTEVIPGDAGDGLPDKVGAGGLRAHHFGQFHRVGVEECDHFHAHWHGHLHRIFAPEWLCLPRSAG